jgi:hypothetical protein
VNQTNAQSYHIQRLMNLLNRLSSLSKLNSIKANQIANSSKISTRRLIHLKNERTREEEIEMKPDSGGGRRWR